MMCLNKLILICIFSGIWSISLAQKTIIPDSITRLKKKVKVVPVIEFDLDSIVEQERQLDILHVRMDSLYRIEAERIKQLAIENDSTVEIPFYTIEYIPTFPGGNANLRKYLTDNIKYPKASPDSVYQGSVVVDFTVKRDGSITDVKLAKSFHPAFDSEAMRVIKSQPKWVPGKSSGKSNRRECSIAIIFKTEEAKKQKGRNRTK